MDDNEIVGSSKVKKCEVVKTPQKKEDFQNFCRIYTGITKVFGQLSLKSAK